MSFRSIWRERVNPVTNKGADMFWMKAHWPQRLQALWRCIRSEGHIGPDTADTDEIKSRRSILENSGRGLVLVSRSESEPQTVIRMSGLQTGYFRRMHQWNSLSTSFWIWRQWTWAVSEPRQSHSFIFVCLCWFLIGSHFTKDFFLITVIPPLTPLCLPLDTFMSLYIKNSSLCQAVTSPRVDFMSSAGHSCELRPSLHKHTQLCKNTHPVTRARLQTTSAHISIWSTCVP